MNSPTHLTILLETFDLLAINKPAGLAVHDAPGPGQSVLRWLQENGQHKNLTPVHRLDKDASGVLLFAKSKAVVTTLTNAWPNAQKFYTALCSGIPQRDFGTVVAPILEHQTGKPERLASAVKWFKEQNPHVNLPPLPPPKTSAVHPAGRVSQTDYRVLEKFTLSGSDTDSCDRFSLLEVRPKQGRMHQIRVHLTHLDCPLMLDSLYGKNGKNEEQHPLPTSIPLTRMPLHASKLIVPFQGRELCLEAPLPEDILLAIDFLRIKNDPAATTSPRPD